jgi:scyllo-inositol 2-dehydrogenase (NAD+)
MKNEIRCAAIGVGRLGFFHAQNLAERVPGAKLVAVGTSRQESAEKAASQLGVEKATNNLQDIFEDPEIDAVVISTPTNTHADLIIKAAKHKKHIFVDKPITETLDEADEVIKHIKEHGVICQVGFMRRFDPAYAEAKKRIEAGDIGEPLYFKGLSRDPGSPPEDFIKDSGGIFVDLAIHDYDIAQFLMGSPVKSVYSTGKVLVHSFMKKYNDVDQAITIVRFESGESGDIESSRNSAYGYDVRGEVVGTEGAIQISSMKYHDIVVMNKNGSTHDHIPIFPIKFQEAFLLEISHFIDCLRKDKKPIVTEIDGKKALEVSVAAKRSFETEKEVFVGDAK